MSVVYSRLIDGFVGFVSFLSARTGVDVGHLLLYGLVFLIVLAVFGRR